MSAAALRPDLFTHLFATQRAPHDKSDLAATALSVALHGGVVLALIWASSTIKPEKTRVVEALPHPIVIATPEDVERGGGGGGSGSSERRFVVPERIDISDFDPKAVTVPPDDPWAPGLGDTPPISKVLPGGAAGLGAEPDVRGGFAVSRTIPKLLNPQEVQRALERSYPTVLREARIGGKVILWLLIDENGRVVDSEIKERSGQPALDDAARAVGEMMRFSPGMNREQRVKVWVSLPVVFTAK